MMDELVLRLTSYTQKVKLESRAASVAEIKSRIEHGFVFLDFIDTKGTTELGLNINAGSVINQNQNLKFTGTCELNFHRVSCHADIDMNTLHGTAEVKLL